MTGDMNRRSKNSSSNNKATKRENQIPNKPKSPNAFNHTDLSITTYTVLE